MTSTENQKKKDENNVRNLLTEFYEALKKTHARAFCG
jgi:hypothetical protein